MTPGDLVVTGPRCAARIAANSGARVQSLIDTTSGREILYQRRPQEVTRERFATCSTGGWDLLFPNDSPWRDFADHGVAWNAPFSVDHSEARTARMRAELKSPAVEITQTFTLLPAPRCGVRLATTVNARDATGPFLLAHHPMLAIGEGWEIDGAGEFLTADDELPGRFAPGRMDAAAQALARVVPPATFELDEVIYANRCVEAVVRAPDGRSGTRVSWDSKTLPYLWIVAVPPRFGNDSALLFEPCTSRPYHLEDAITAGTARSPAAGGAFATWCEVESLDERVPAVGSH